MKDMTLSEYLEKKVREVYREYEYTECGEYDAGYCDGYSQAIYDVERYDPWIPVSQPPKEDGYFLVTVKDEEEDIPKWIKSHCDLPYCDFAFFVGGKWTKKNVIAWQDKPVPYSYKGETK